LIHPGVDAVVDAQVFEVGRIPGAWRRRCQVDQQLRLLPNAPTLAEFGLA
jgi:hypothetical protein